MALPLPQVVPDTQAGGGLVTSMRGMNALSNDMLANKIKGIQAQYAPMTTYADAASKLAYANLMGPQFLAKLMGNQDILANMKNPGGAVNQLQQTVMGGSGGVNPLSQFGAVPQPQTGSQFTGALSNLFRNIFGGSQQSPQGQSNAPTQQPQNMGNYGQPQAQPNVQMPPVNNAGGDSNELNQAIAAWVKSPQAAAQAQQQGMMTIPSAPQLLSWYRSQQAPATQGQGSSNGYAYNADGTNQVASPQEVSQIANQGNNSGAITGGNTPFAQNVADYASVKAQGQKEGEIRAQNMSDMGDAYSSAIQKESTLNHLGSVLTSPQMMQIRQLPIGQAQSIGYYSKFGTPGQKDMIGKFKADIGEVVKDAASDFKGQFRVGEQQLINNMKVNDNDDINVAIGKWKSLMYTVQLIKQRSAIANNLMKNQHMDKTDALEKANSMINTNQIQQNVNSMINPNVQIRNKKTGQVVSVPFDEAQRRMWGQ